MASERFGIAGIGTWLPEARQDNRERAAAFGFAPDFLTTKLGFVEVARKDPGDDTSDLCCRAYRSLEEKIADRQVDLIVVVTQNPDGGGLPHVSALVHGKLGLPKTCFAFDISLGCSGYVAGLAAVKGFLAATGGRRAVLITCDPYSKIVDPADRDTSLIFGDAATATLIEESDRWRIGAFDFGTDGSRAGVLEVRENGKLFMNGRGVFDFCALNVPGSVERTLAANALRREDIDALLLHSGSRYIVDVLSARIGMRADGFPAASYGNTVSSSLPMMLAELDPTEKKTVLLSGFGVGLSWATTILRSFD